MTNRKMTISMKNLVLLMTSVVLAQQCAAGQLCTNSIPGVSKMANGVDITTLDLFPLDGIVPGGMRFPILSFTCSKNGTWKTPDTQKEYERPDNVWGVDTIPGGYTKAEIKVVRSSTDVRKKMAVGVSVGGGYGGFAFSASTSYSKMQNSITNSSKQIQDVSSFESATRIDWVPTGDLLDYYAKEHIGKLTGTYEKNMAAYNRFIKKFGTHYFTRAAFGGMIRSYMETSTSYSYTKTDEQLKVEAQGSYNGLLASISVAASFENGKTKASSEFTSQTSTTIKYYGGTTNLLAANGLKTWQQSVDKDPWLVSGSLAPIYQLIEDETKKKNVKTAIDQYVQRTYLKELLRLVIAAKLKFQLNHPTLVNLQTRVNAQQNLRILDLTEIGNLRTEIEYQVNIPEWFTKHTRICLQYRATHTGHGQCNGGDDLRSKSLCALPNKNTHYYLDNTSEWPGGCSMQWSILSNNPPAWFLKAQICFKWEASGHIVPCNSMQRAEVCAPVNKMTTPYIDNTSHVSNHCSMSWKIKLPSDAPLWINKSELCYQWEPSHDARNCRAYKRKLCAYPNTWTEWYSDVTQQIRNGGCRMRWGWNLLN